MSIINQVLQDLEHRQSQAVEGEENWSELAWPSAQAVATKKKRKNLLRIAVVVLLSLIAALLAITLYQIKDSAFAESDTGKSPVTRQEKNKTKKQQPVKQQKNHQTKQAASSVTKPKKNTTSSQSARVTQPEKKPVKKAAAVIATTAVTSGQVQAKQRAVTQKQPQLAMTKVPASAVGYEDMAATQHNDEAEFADEAAETITGQQKLSKTVRPLTSAQQAELAYQAGYQLLKRNHLAAGEAKLVSALNFDSRHIKAREMLVGLLVKTGRKVEAKSMLQQGLLTSPEYTNFAKFYARMLWDENKIANAIDVLRQFAPAIDVDPDYHAMLAASLQRNKQHKNAASLYVKLLKIRPREGMWWVGMAISLEALGKQEQALQAYAKARQSGNLNARLQQYSTQRLTQLTGDEAEVVE